MLYLFYMRIIRNEDFYSVNVSGYVSNVELQALNILYTPFIGVVSALLYVTLLRTRPYKNGELINHEFLTTQLQISNDQLMIALRNLEAVSLITTYKKTHKHFEEYIYVLSAPKNPALFSEDEVLMFLLENVVGERHTQSLLQLFKLDESAVDAPDVSADFSSVYGETFVGATVSTKQQRIKLTNEIARVVTPFDKALFFNELTRTRQILPTALSEEEVTKIKQTATLFNVTERAIAEKVGDFYQANKKLGARVDIKALNSALFEIADYPEMIRPLKRRKIQKLSSESELAKMINKMETVSPYDFLYELNNFTKIALRDKQIIDLLIYDLKLSNPATNALLYYALETYDNVLPRAAIEKLASSIQRKGLSSALDVYDSLVTPVKYKRAKKSAPAPTAQASKKQEQPPAQEGESIASMIADIFSEDEK